MTKHECAVVMAHTGVCMLQGEDFGIFHKYITDIMGRPVFTHEIPRLAQIIKERSREDFIRICKEATD